MWGWVELRYADGLTLVMNSGEWGDGYNRKQAREVQPSDLSEEDQRKVQEMPDPEPLIGFEEAVKTRKKPGGHAEAAHRTRTRVCKCSTLFVRPPKSSQEDPLRVFACVGHAT